MRKNILVLVSLLTPAGSALAQDDFFAAAAIASTPMGALTPLMSPSMVGLRLNGAQLAPRYGQRRDGSVDTYSLAGSVIFPVRLASSVSLTGGIRDASCNGCSPDIMLGLAGDMRIYEGGEFAQAGSGLAVSLSGDLGYGRAFGDDDAWAFGVGMPLTLSLATGGRESLHVVPFFTPIFGVGQTDCPAAFPNCDRSGTRAVLGGGIGVWNPMTSVSASVGVNRVMRDGENTVFGINVSFGGR